MVRSKVPRGDYFGLIRREISLISMNEIKQPPCYQKGVELSRVLWISLVISLVSACGGGSLDPVSVDQLPANQAPTFSVSEQAFSLEGSLDALTLIAADANNDRLYFRIAGGADESKFAIRGDDALEFLVPPDFEMPADENGDNEYLVTIKVTDGKTEVAQTFAINVEDAFEGRVVDAPVGGASVFVDLDEDGKLGEGEPFGVTNADGFFYLIRFEKPEGADPRVVSYGGTDAKTGNLLDTLTLFSPIPTDLTQFVSVTPISTMLSSAETPRLKRLLLDAFGLAIDPQELLTTDIWAQAESGDEGAKAVQRINQQLGLLLQTLDTLVKTDNQDAPVEAGFPVALALTTNLNEFAQANGELKLSAAETIQAVLVSSITAVAPNLNIGANEMLSLATSIAELNGLTSSITLDPTASDALALSSVAQTGLLSLIADLITGVIDSGEFTVQTQPQSLYAEIITELNAVDFDQDGLADFIDYDDDNDGIFDIDDALPLDSTESIDTDLDGIGDNADLDDDNDGVLDANDKFSLDASETADNDNDGIGDNADTDDDNDGVGDSLDAFPFDVFETSDSDDDGIGDNADLDDDNDGVLDEADAYPLISLGQLSDLDGDGRPNECDVDCIGLGMLADTDDDGDNALDSYDYYPLISTGFLPDVDLDGLPDTCDLACLELGMHADEDDDGDGVLDFEDPFPKDSSISLAKAIPAAIKILR
jgi:hypothetical protein